MNYNYDIKIISEKDIIDAGCFNLPAIINICEEVLLEYNDGKTIFPEKVSTIFNEEKQNRINCLPAGILPENIYGMKWVSVFPNNPVVAGVPNLSAVILLSELITGYPIALLEGGICTNLRTAAVGAIAAKYLARKDSVSIGIIGAGEQAKSHLLAIKSVLPHIQKCKVASRSITSETAFIENMQQFVPDLEFISCNSDYQEAVKDADIIVTAISGQEKILQSEWIKDGTFYIHVGGLEDDFSVPIKATKIVCDDWNTVKHRTQTISQMHKLGLLKDEDIYANLSDLILSKKAGRENDQEFIYFNSVGLSFIDIKVAIWMYKKVLDAGLGVTAKIKEDSIFDYGLNNFVI